ncbi:MAG: PQQ-binding-like beta-propeller repeat protein [Archaeoglobaceae archaeon]
MKWLILLAALLIFLSGCVEERKQTTPVTVPTATPTQTPLKTTTPTPTTTVSKRGELEEISPTKIAEEIPKDYLLKLTPWKLPKGSERNDFYTPQIPRKPELDFIINISANFDGLSTPLVEDFIYIVDGWRVYAYTLDGKQLWTFDVYENYKKRIKAYGLGNYLYIGTTSAEKGISLLALDKEKGRVVWEKEINIAGSVSALIVSKIVCFGTDYLDPFVMCFEENGTKLWSQKVAGTVKGFAFGDGILFVSADYLYAFDETGKLLWKIERSFSTPIYKNGLLIVSSYGYVTAFSKDGTKLWEKDFKTGEDLKSNPFISASNVALFIPRVFGSKPFELQLVGFDGNLLGNFKLEDDEIPGFPVVSDEVVLLPVKTEKYGKVYFLWRGKEVIHEIKEEGEEVFMPTIAVSNGEIFVLFSKSREKHVLWKLSDKISPEILNISVTTHGNEVTVSLTTKDTGSAIHRAMLVYSENSKWEYKDMDLGRRYFIEPMGGYGFNEEVYVGKLTVSNILHFYAAVIDNSNNVAKTPVYAYRLT